MSLGHSMVMFMRMLCCGQGCCEGCCWRRSWSQMCCSARCCLECSEGEQERDGRQNLQSCYDDFKNILVQLFWTLEEYHSAVVFICVYWQRHYDHFTKHSWMYPKILVCEISVLFFSCKSPLFRQSGERKGWRFFECCFGDSSEISSYPGPIIVLLCRSLSQYMFCKPSWQGCYMDLSNLLLISVRPRFWSFLMFLPLLLNWADSVCWRCELCKVWVWIGHQLPVRQITSDSKSIFLLQKSSYLQTMLRLCD